MACRAVLAMVPKILRQDFHGLDQIIPFGRGQEKDSAWSSCENVMSLTEGRKSIHSPKTAVHAPRVPFPFLQDDVYDIGPATIRFAGIPEFAIDKTRPSSRNLFMEPDEQLPIDRRQWLQRAATAAGASLALTSGCSCHEEKPAAPSKGPLLFPGKVEMRIVNDRPPCLETPWNYFQQDLTPNDAFYVRWHLQVIPTKIDLRSWRLRIGGHVERPIEFSIEDLRRLESDTIIAVNQCSGNSRELFQPSVAGAQWGNGAMGNALWTGVPLRKLLNAAGLKAGAGDVSFLGLDRGGIPTIPDYVKTLKIDKAREPEVLVAYEMNSQPLPMLNGFPARLVVPGWYATYWIKALSEITVLTKDFDGYWMNKAYRIPTTPQAQESPQSLATETTPIHRMNVRSFFTAPESGARLALGQTCPLEGIAFDGGDGIERVEVSVDGGQTWRETALGDDLGRFSFRRWKMPWQPEAAGDYTLKVRATSRAGETQPAEAVWNRAGYMRNVIEQWSVTVG